MTDFWLQNLTNCSFIAQQRVFRWSSLYLSYLPLVSVGDTLFAIPVVESPCPRFKENQFRIRVTISHPFHIRNEHHLPGNYVYHVNL